MSDTNVKIFRLLSGPSPKQAIRFLPFDFSLDAMSLPTEAIDLVPRPWAC